MAVAIEGTPVTGLDIETPGTVSYTAETTGSDRLLLHLGGFDAAGGRTFTAAKFGGSGGTSMNVELNANSVSGHAFAWWLEQASIPAGANDFYATFSGTTIESRSIAMTLSGADQTTPFRATDPIDISSAVSSMPWAGLSAEAGDLSVVVVCLNSTGTNPNTSGYTEHYDSAATMTGSRVAVYSKAIASTATETPVTTWGGTTTGAGLHIIVKAASGASVAPIVMKWRM